jgi:hypothetical protein
MNEDIQLRVVSVELAVKASDAIASAVGSEELPFDTEDFFAITQSIYKFITGEPIIGETK